MGTATRHLTLARPPGSLFPFLYLGSTCPPVPVFHRLIPVTKYNAVSTRARRHRTSPIPPRCLHTSSLVSNRVGHKAHAEHQQPPHAPYDDALGEEIPFETSPDSQDDGARPSSITSTEKEAFGRLFGTLLKPRPQNTSKTRSSRKHAKNANSGEEQSLVLAAEAEIAGQPADEDNQHWSSEQIGPEATARLARYPQPLRDMAAKAQLRLAKKAKADQREDQVAVEAKEEMRRVEAKMLAAESDLALWNVLEKEVFSKIEQLDLDAKPPALTQQAQTPSKASEKVNKRKAAPNTKAKEPPAQKPTAPADNALVVPAPEAETPSRTPKPTPQPNLAILIHAYAPLLLAALRLLIQRAPRSPLPGALLSRAKALGPTSYALAASTPLYNDLLSWTWRTTASYAQLLALLRAMDAAGLTMDAGTLEAVDTVAAYRAHVAAGRQALGRSGVAVERDCAGRAREGEELLAWRERIRGGLEEMEVERVRRAEALRAFEVEERRELEQDRHEREVEAEGEGFEVPRVREQFSA